MVMVVVVVLVVVEVVGPGGGGAASDLFYARSVVLFATSRFLPHLSMSLLALECSDAWLNSAMVELGCAYAMSGTFLCHICFKIQSTIAANRECLLATVGEPQYA